jgi:acetoin utilization deacetylase AcuC-like enzyme
MRIDEIVDGLTHQESIHMLPSEVDEGDVWDHLRKVHDEDYLDFLEESSKESGVHRPIPDPTWSAPGVKADTAVWAGSAAAARSAAGAALSAARLVTHGTDIAYALCRPPGHHAGRRSMGGYCYLNNAAVAVSCLRADETRTVGVLDIDFHFGNGTAAIVADDDGVWLESLHASTIESFPWRASNPINARHRHHEFAQAPSPSTYLGELDDALQNLLVHCDAIVVSLGYDIVWGDPHGHWSLPPLIFRDIGARLATTGLPVCVIQEGGYARRQLAGCASSFATGITLPVTSGATLP